MINEIRKKYNSKKIVTDEGVTTYGKLTSEKINKEKTLYSKLESKFNKDPMSLSLDEIQVLRNKSFNENKVNLKYKDGFIMLNAEGYMRELKRTIPYDVRGMIEELGSSINKNGCITYLNKKPIQNVSGIMEHLGISRKIWSKFNKYNQEYDILRKEKIDGVWYILLNPLFYSSSYEITYFKFLSFGKLLKENGYISELDYVLLCKKHEIIPEK